MSTLEIKINIFKKALCDAVSAENYILGIAQTGDIHAPLIPQNSDIDLFVLCRTVPDRKKREEIYSRFADDLGSVQMEVCNCEHWGIGDVFIVDGIDIMPMYFDIGAFYAYIEDLLSGKHLLREDRFYPIGRLASVESINILYEKEDAWTKLKDSVKHRPQELFEKWYAVQSALILDEEDLGRAKLRCDVLFYHQVLEEALDHFLQAMYALNDTYFPSRKRNAADIDRFARKPGNCLDRLQSIMEKSVKPNTIPESVRELYSLTDELKAFGMPQSV